jgi:hypothetical protein
MIDLPGDLDEEKGECHDLVAGKHVPSGGDGPYRDARAVAATLLTQVRRAQALHDRDLQRGQTSCVLAQRPSICVM